MKLLFFDDDGIDFFINECDITVDDGDYRQHRSWKCDDSQQRKDECETGHESDRRKEKWNLNGSILVFKYTQLDQPSGLWNIRGRSLTTLLILFV